MKTKSLHGYVFLVLVLISMKCISINKIFAADLKGFVMVRGLQYERQGSIINVSDFEILDHPVTNLEYKAFIDDTKYPAPLHWEKGMIPGGKENYPVIFVNRDDAEAYCKWLTKITGRIHRIPTSFEFEFAARGGKNNSNRYFWGNSDELFSGKTSILT